jgi:hypothetical protein
VSRPHTRTITASDFSVEIEDLRLVITITGRTTGNQPARVVLRVYPFAFFSLVAKARSALSRHADFWQRSVARLSDYAAGKEGI